MVETLNAYLVPLKKRYEAMADVDNAQHMRAYLKDQFVFYGVKTEDRRAMMKSFFTSEEFPDKDELVEVVKQAWELPQREYQYFAAELLIKQVKHLKKDHLKLIEHCITHKSWWDTVDLIAIKLAGPFFKRFPELFAPTNKKWVNSKNMWLNRSALLFQVKYKKDTDQDMLFNNIETLAEKEEFWIRKAIGWTLREHAKTFPKEVKAFVKKHPELSPLSKREALRNI